MISPLSDAEKSRTVAALTETNGNVTEAAKLLGLARTTVSARKKVLQKFNKASSLDTLSHNTALKIFVLPDVQVKPGISLDYLKVIGEYVADKHPDIIVCIGDFADMESLSSYDVGKKSFEGRTYKADIVAAKAGMKAFMMPIRQEMIDSSWQPRLVLTLGNHEDRITRAIELDRKLDGTISLDDLGYEKWGWEVYPFLEPVEIQGVMFCHYFTSGVMGRAIQTASALISKKHQSCVAGHQQGRMVAYGNRADGSPLCAIICGSAYLHQEKYLGIQGNKHWRGVIMLHEVQNGSFDEMFVSLNFLMNVRGRK